MCHCPIHPSEYYETECPLCANNGDREPARPNAESVPCSAWLAAARTCETLANEIDVYLKTVGTETMRELTNLSDDRHALQRAARALQTKAASVALSGAKEKP